ncbi:GNAT family N-acetyltransferase [Bosea sp. (in: a-proteobacteria)]|uniref:GNAT family N-acetyltransferase n=1 Tax=Bosea sp. (in: a-proteobacteria) TaxID=1871050 RepID=UPI0027324C2E|nr:GNAT family N-acetyltransferase [Bosea sp. (in: a-proteobacteria)]MDP3257519.1 GNAT family N-acetyltransferase [Bosea sp. (in: a-proteobacteria)]
MGDTLIREAALLRDIKPAVAAAGAGLARAVGWPHRVEDWAMAIGLGRGVVATVGEEVVATALWWPYGEDHATLGMIIVSPEHQGGGLGRRLMQALLAQTEGRSLLLNATVPGQPLYEKLGFVVYGAIRQYQGEVGADPILALVDGTTLRPAALADLPVLEQLDQAATGLPRGRLLRAVLEAGEGTVLMRGGEVAGFSMVRRFGRGLVIGPVVAADLADARALLAHGLQARQGQFVRVDVDDGSSLAEMVMAAGLKPVDSVNSMVRGSLPRPAGPVRRYTLASQALG